MSGEQQSFLAGAANGGEAAASATTTAADTTAAAQSTGPEAVAPPPQAAAGQTAATPGATAPAETQPATSGGADAQTTAPVEVKVPDGVEWSKPLIEAYQSGDEKRIAEAGAAAQKALLEQAEKKGKDEWDALDNKWRQEVEQDKEMGGQHMAETRMLLSKGIASSKETMALAQLLDKFGYGNHPVVVGAFRWWGQQGREDTIAGTTAPTTAPGSKDVRTTWFNAPGYEGLNP